METVMVRAADSEGGSLLSFLKTSAAAEILAFQPTAGYRLQHANHRRDPRRVRPQDCPGPHNVTAGIHRSSPTSGGALSH